MLLIRPILCAPVGMILLEPYAFLRHVKDSLRWVWLALRYHLLSLCRGSGSCSDIVGRRLGHSASCGWRFGGQEWSATAEASESLVTWRIWCPFEHPIWSRNQGKHTDCHHSMSQHWESPTMLTLWSYYEYYQTHSWRWAANQRTSPLLSFHTCTWDIEQSQCWCPGRDRWWHQRCLSIQTTARQHRTDSSKTLEHRAAAWHLDNPTGMSPSARWSQHTAAWMSYQHHRSPTGSAIFRAWQTTSTIDIWCNPSSLDSSQDHISKNKSADENLATYKAPKADCSYSMLLLDFRGLRIVLVAEVLERLVDCSWCWVRELQLVSRWCSSQSSWLNPYLVESKLNIN